MDRKKLQELVSELSNELELGETVKAKETAETVEAQTVAANGVSKYADAYPNGLLYNRNGAGEPINGFAVILADNGKPLYFDLDYEAFLKAHNLAKSEVTSCVLYVSGKTRSRHFRYRVETQTGKYVFERDFIGGNFYEVDLKYIYEKFGNASFKMTVSELYDIVNCGFIKVNSGSKSYYANTRSKANILGIYVEKRPDKVIYQPGEAFDPTGMVVVAYFDNGIKETIVDYETLCEETLTRKDQIVTLKYMDKTAMVRISVGEDKRYTPPDESLNNGFGIFIDELETPYIRVSAINGQLPAAAGEVELPGSIDFEVNFAGLLSANKYVLDETTDYSLCIMGKLKNGNVQNCYVHEYASDKRICKLSGYNNMYFVPLRRIYEETGSANFRIYAKANSVAHEVFILKRISLIARTSSYSSLKIVAPPKKTTYLVGERFYSYGMSVKASLTFGGGKIITDYTVEPNRAFIESDTKITVKSGNSSVSFPIKVSGYKVAPKFFKYSRTKTDGVWSDWNYENEVSDITAARSGNYEFKTVMTLNKEDIVTSKRPTTGLRLAVNKNADNAAEKVLINGIETPLRKSGSFVYIGNIDRGESGTLEVNFEYSGAYLSLNAGVEPKVYFSDPADPTVQSQKKSYSLAGGVDFSVDLLRGSSTFSLADISSADDCLGINLAHVYNPENYYAEYGENLRLNLCERLNFSDAFNGPEPTPVYTDGAGNINTFTVMYSVDRNDEKFFLNSEGIKSLVKQNGGYLFNGKSVKISHLTVNGYKYALGTESAVEANKRYQQLKSDNDPAVLPVYWIKTDNLYKGFNADGKLTFTCDKFGHFTQINYSADGKIVSVEDGLDNKINLTYADGKLDKITDSRGREIRFGYSSGSSNQLETVKWYGTDGQLIKDVKLSYKWLTVNGVSVYALSGVIEGVSGVRSQITYIDDGLDARVCEISDFSSYADSINSGGEKISSFSFEYGVYSTTLSDEHGYEERYEFNSDGTLKSLLALSNSYIVKAEEYEYVPFEKQVVKTVREKYLGSYDYQEFIDFINELEYKKKKELVRVRTTYLNAYNLPVKITEGPFDSGTAMYTETTYEYDDEFKVTRETLTEEEYAIFKYCSVTDFTYDSVTKLPIKSVKTVYRISSDITTKEYTEVEECEYDKNGCVSLTKNYRYAADENADDADVFYTEKGYNYNKKLISETEERGLYCNTYRYKSKTNLLSEAAAPHGGTVYFGYDGSDRLSSVRATSDGLENANTVAYEKGELKTLNHTGDNALEYTYDEKHRPLTVSIGGELYESYAYYEDVSAGHSCGEMITVTNAKGERFSAVAAYNGKYESASYNNNEIIVKDYDAIGRLEKIRDRIIGKDTGFTYNSKGNLSEYTVYSETYAPEFIESYTYGFRNRIKGIKYKCGVAVVREDAFVYSDGALNELTQLTTGDYKVTYGYRLSGDLLSRNIFISGSAVDSDKIDYVKEDDHATHMPKRITYNNGNYIDYTYDGRGNITEIRKKGVLTARYKYDSLNRLVREDNSELNESYFYTYDGNGNILTKETSEYTLDEHIAGTDGVISYGYDKDQLTSYGDETFTYDKIGNPTAYRGKTLVWTMGRKLTRFEGMSFKYDGQGRRISKSGTEFYYDSQGRIWKQSNGLEFFYDATGLLGLKYDGKSYVYRKDIQGNITAIIDNTGAIVVEYTYDAWGNHKITDNEGNAVTDGVGVLNPFRYRSYYYDRETKLYYLQTRYYDPETGRFINMDGVDYADPETINGLNLYAYCGNNPVMNIDPEGRAWWHWLIGAAIVVGLVAATVATAGGAAAGFVAIAAAASGTAAAGASVATTTLAFASVGAGVAYAASAVVGGMHGLDSAINSGSAADGFATFMDHGESAMWNTVGGGVVGGIGGYFSHIEYGEKTPGKLHPWGTYHNTKDQTITHYNFRGNMSWSKHLTDHGNPKHHVVPHYHAEMPHSKEIDSKGKLALELLRRLFGG